LLIENGQTHAAFPYLPITAASAPAYIRRNRQSRPTKQWAARRA